MDSPPRRRLRRIVILTSTKPRHRFFASFLSSRLQEVAGIFVERKREHPSRGLTPFIRRHFEGFDEAEASFFGDERLPEDIPVFETSDINEEAERVRKLAPDIILVYGTGILRAPLIGAAEHVINMHLGLSPYYRGSGTNFWPFHEGEPEYVGTTIHYIDENIDSGEIITQARPPIDPLHDTIHTIGCKSIVAGTEEMARAVNRLQEAGSLPSARQEKSRGRLYLRKHFTEEACRRAYGLIDGGLIRDYTPREVDIVVLD